MQPCPFCTACHGKCEEHQDEYEPELHGPNGRYAERRERLREIEEFRRKENQANEMRMLRELLKK
jgi:cytochrome c553